MNSPAHGLSLLAAFMFLVMGLSSFFPSPWTSLPPSWAQLYRLVPGSIYLYPIAYILAGIMAGIGVWKPTALRYSYIMSAILFFSWGILGLYSMIQGTGGNIAGAAANFYVTGVALVLAYYESVGARGNRIKQQITEIQEQIDK